MSQPTAPVHIAEVLEVTEEVEAACEVLLPQLGAARLPTREELEEIVGSAHTRLLAARLPEHPLRIVGLLTLVLFRIPTARCARIEDVVVDEAVRGRGIGAALVRAALEQAAQAGATKVDLTSRPEREAANRLYQRLGFVQRETNVYRYDLGDR